VTLYELLALQPAFTGQDRQELLRQLTLEEPHPIRRFNPEVPTDLETIILKAMNKEPESRYATAQEMAEDLRRFLEHKPIKARRPSVSDRLAKWIRRHTVLVASTMALLMLSVMGLTTATLLISREQSRTQRAYQAEALLRRKTRKAVDEMYGQVAEQLLTQKPDMEKIRHEFLERALVYYREFDAENEHDPVARHEAAKAVQRVGEIERRLGHYPEAEQAYRQAISLVLRARDIFAKLVEAYPKEPYYRYGLSMSDSDLADTVWVQGRRDEAERFCRVALKLSMMLLDDLPGRREYSFLVATRFCFLGELLRARGEMQEAEASVRKAVLIAESLAHDLPEVFWYTLFLGEANTTLGLTLKAEGRLDEAEQTLRRSLAIAEKLAADLTSHSEILPHLADLNASARPATSGRSSSEIRRRTPGIGLCLEHSRHGVLPRRGLERIGRGTPEDDGARR